MKIAMVDPSLFTWPYDSALIDGLRAGGHRVTLYTKVLGAADREAAKAAYVCQLFYPGFETGFMRRLPKPLFLALKGIAHILSMLALWLVLLMRRPDVIHFQWVPLPVIDRFFVPLFRFVAPVVLTVHDSSPFNNNPSARLQAMGAVRIMAAFDRLIVHTEHARQKLIAYGHEAGKIRLIQHGVLRALPQTLPLPKEPIGETKSSPDDIVSLLLFGKLKPYKGADILIRALAELPADIRAKTRLSIVGQAQMDIAPLVGLARDLKVDNNIVWDLRFVGEDEMARLFAAADIMVVPYRDIDASGVLMQALSVGRPIVASRIGLFAELLQDGTHGFLVPPENPAALAAAIGRLVVDPALRDRMGANVRALQASIPGWEDIGDKTAALYAELKA